MAPKGITVLLCLGWACNGEPGSGQFGFSMLGYGKVWSGGIWLVGLSSVQVGYVMDSSKMPPDVRRKLFDIRCKSKEGRSLTAAEERYYKECFAKWPEDYKAMEKDIFEATRPFGSK